MKMDERIFPDLDALSRAALDGLLRIVDEAVTQRGRCAIALSGGHTPETLYDLWARKHSADTPWAQLHLFWSDERFVPRNDPLSNFRMTRENLISRVPIPAENVHAVRTDLPSPAAAADAYESDLRRYFGSAQPAFDLQLQGLGVEGHTASLFPGSPLLEEKRRWVAAVDVPAAPPQRITFTPAVLDCGRNTFFLAAGADKREILAAIRAEIDPRSSSYPAAKISPSGPVVWFLDTAAAG